MHPTFSRALWWLPLLAPGIESFNPMGNIRSEFEDCPISLTTIATMKD